MTIFWSEAQGMIRWSCAILWSRENGEKYLFWMPELNSFTCHLIYWRKASLDHLPSNNAVYTGTPARYIAMAAPIRAKCRPICSAVNPNLLGPMAVAASLSFEKCLDRCWCNGWFLPIFSWGIESFHRTCVVWWHHIFHLIFCSSKVFETQSGKCRSGSLWGNNLLFLLNLMLCTCSNLVFHWPDTWPYSRNLMAKKKASINSSHSAF